MCLQNFRLCGEGGLEFERWLSHSSSVLGEFVSINANISPSIQLHDGCYLKVWQDILLTNISVLEAADTDFLKSQM